MVDKVHYDFIRTHFKQVGTKETEGNDTTQLKPNIYNLIVNIQMLFPPYTAPFLSQQY